MRQIKIGVLVMALGVSMMSISRGDDPIATTQAQGEGLFAGEHGNWHGFDKYDFIIDDNLQLKPVGPNDKIAGKRCYVVAPKKAAAGNPWSWQGCYWDHEPQTEIELLKRGFHICYITTGAGDGPSKKWDAFYDFLVKKGLFAKPAFIGMSRGGEFSYQWATNHPNNVSCLYVDNPGGNSENLAKLEGLAKADVPILHVCGSVDPILQKYSDTYERIYQSFGGRISVITKEGAGHHPHSLRDPKPLADFIESSVQAALAGAKTPPEYVKNGAKKSYYSLAEDYREIPTEKNYAIFRGPLFTACYDSYAVPLGFEVPVNVIVPAKVAKDKPWVFRADYIKRDAVVDQQLLAAGFHIVTGPVGYNSSGAQVKDFDKVYKHFTDAGFSKAPVIEGVGGAIGGIMDWACENPDKVSCIYGENVIFNSKVSKVQPIDNLAGLAKQKVPMLLSSGSLDPLLEKQTRVIEKNYKDAGGDCRVILSEGVGHFPTSPKDPKAVVEFIQSHQIIKN